jgi:hypothetical protein
MPRATYVTHRRMRGVAESDDGFSKICVNVGRGVAVTGFGIIVTAVAFWAVTKSSSSTYPIIAVLGAVVASFGLFCYHCGAKSKDENQQNTQGSQSHTLEESGSQTRLGATMLGMPPTTQQSSANVSPNASPYAMYSPNRFSSRPGATTLTNPMGPERHGFGDTRRVTPETSETRETPEPEYPIPHSAPSPPADASQPIPVSDAPPSYESVMGNQTAYAAPTEPSTPPPAYDLWRDQHT